MYIEINIACCMFFLNLCTCMTYLAFLSYRYISVNHEYIFVDNCNLYMHVFFVFNVKKTTCKDPCKIHTFCLHFQNSPFLFWKKNHFGVWPNYDCTCVMWLKTLLLKVLRAHVKHSHIKITKAVDNNASSWFFLDLLSNFLHETHVTYRLWWEDFQ